MWGDITKQSQVAITASVATVATNLGWNFLRQQAASFSSYMPSWFSSAPAAAVVKKAEFLNPFEWIDKCPVPSDVCRPYENWGYISPTFWESLTESAFSVVGPYLETETAQWLGSYAAPMVEVGSGALSAGVEYLPVLASLPEGVRMTRDLVNGRWTSAARHGANVSSSALISVAVANFGLVALPVGLVGKFGLQKAFTMVYGNNEPSAQQRRPLTLAYDAERDTSALAALRDYDADGYLSTAAVLRQANGALAALGLQAVDLDDDTVQLFDAEGFEVGEPRTMDKMRALVAFKDESADVVMDFVEGRFSFNGGAFVPFSELEALWRLTYVDLPNLARLGGIQIRVNEGGQLALILNRDMLPRDLSTLPLAARKLIGYIAAQQDGQLLLQDADASTDTLALVEAASRVGALTSHMSAEGLVPVYGPDGKEVALPLGMVGKAFAKVLDVKTILETPEPDGKLVIKVEKPDGGKENVPVREVQKAVEKVNDGLTAAQRARYKRSGWI